MYASAGSGTQARGVEGSGVHRRSVMRQSRDASAAPIGPARSGEHCDRDGRPADVCSEPALSLQRLALRTRALPDAVKTQVLRWSVPPAGGPWSYYLPAGAHTYITK